VKLKVVGGMIVLTLIAVLCLAWAGAAQAGGMRMGGGSMGGGFHGGGHRGFHGGRFKNPGGFRARVICTNGTCVTTVAINAGFPVYGGGGPALFPEYWSPPETSSAAPEWQTQAEVAPALAREACSPTGCYHLEGDGKEVPYRWAWVPNPPPPPPAPAILQYWNGRYEQQGDGLSAPSRWVWIPNDAAVTSPTAPSPPPERNVPGPSAPVPSQLGPLYRWVDEHGVVHWTQGLETVPERYRPQQGRGSAG
jgi:hypothetical protein